MVTERREFIRQAAGTGSVILLGGVAFGFRYLKQSRARETLHHQMMGDSVRLLAEKASDELVSLPNLARQQLRDYFHGICLNVHGFVKEISSNSFAEKLSSCASEEQKHLLFNVAFSQKVVSAIEVTNRVEMIAAEAGTQLDANWKQLCQKLADPWRKSLQLKRPEAMTLSIPALVDPLIKNSLEAARQTTYPIGQRPALTTTGIKIGKAALMLFPVAAVQPQLAYPMFVVTALKAVWEWFLGKPSEAAYQTVISERLANLGNRIGADCQEEVRRRVADLQHWQEQALSTIAHEKVNETINAVI